MELNIDANGYAIDLRKRGLRRCQQCDLVMSAGFSTDNGDVYACDTRCLELLGVEQSTSEEINNDESGDAVYWTDWEGDESHDDAVERLLSAPYKFTEEEMHNVGCHEDNPEDWRNCTICQGTR